MTAPSAEATKQHWVQDAGVYELGELSAGDRIYFAVGRNGYFFFDAAEIAWQITAIAAL